MKTSLFKQNKKKLRFRLLRSYLNNCLLERKSKYDSVFPDFIAIVWCGCTEFFEEFVYERTEVGTWTVARINEELNVKE